MDRVCLGCGVAVRYGPKCRSCTVKARWARTHPKPAPARCRQCSGEITGGGEIYCSRQCMNADPGYQARKGAGRRNRVTKTCPGCQTTFDVPTSSASRYTYCTRVCSNASRGRDAVCVRCGAAFRHGQTVARRYCSEACRRPPVVGACQHCAITMRFAPSKSGRRRYCSKRCYFASGTETSIERRVRENLERLRYDHRAQAQIGPWVVDFLVGARLVVEADGSYWHTLRPDVDRRKTADLASRGYTVWRLPEVEINDAGFSAEFERRLIDYEVTGGEVPRIAPDILIAELD